MSEGTVHVPEAKLGIPELRMSVEIIDFKTGMKGWFQCVVRNESRLGNTAVIAARAALKNAKKVKP